jgi:hypothetical protein
MGFDSPRVGTSTLSVGAGNSAGWNRISTRDTKGWLWIDAATLRRDFRVLPDTSKEDFSTLR